MSEKLLIEIKQTSVMYFTDNAYACDPRIQRFKDEEKEKKLAQKKAKQDAARQRQEEEERVGLLASNWISYYD